MIRLTRPECPNPSALQTNYKHPENKSALREACNDKCMYCESRVTNVYFGDVEHIRPKTAFEELEFVWENLGFVCARCNNAKSNKWDETTPFVDPFSEDPADHLVPVGNFVFHVAGDERGEYTWREIDLNRPELLLARQERIEAIRNLIDKVHRTKSETLRRLAAQELVKETGAAAVFSSAAMAVVQILLPENL